jgi:hypothetical protein
MNSLPDAVSEGLIFAAIYLPLLLIADYYFGNIVYSLAYFLELFLQLGGYSGHIWMGNAALWV